MNRLNLLTQLLRRQSLLISFLIPAVAICQFDSIVVEAVFVHQGDIPELDGMKTYRVFAQFNSPDTLVTIYGNHDVPFAIHSSTGFYQHPLGTNFGFDQSELAMDFFPSLQFDSWVTINAEVQQSGFSVIDPNLDFQAFAEGGALVFSTGSSLGSYPFWTIPSSEPEIGATSSENRVLIAQLTADSTAIIHGMVNFEYSNLQRSEGSTFNSQNTPETYIGCLDSTATNFNPDALLQLNSHCYYECELEISVNEVNHTCPGMSAGQIQVSVSGAQYSSSLTLTNESGDAMQGSSNQFSLLSPGIYTAKATDEANCMTEIEIIVHEFDQDPISVQVGLFQAISCPDGNDGSIYALGTGGSGFFEFCRLSSIDAPTTHLTQFNISLGDTCIFSDLSSDCYYITMKDDSTCYGYSDSLCIQNLPPTILEYETWPPSCTNGDDGGAIITALDPNGTLLSGMAFEIANSTFTQNPQELQLIPGIHEIYLTDSLGCSLNDLFAIDNPPEYVDCDGLCESDLNHNGICDSYELATVASGASYCGPNTTWDGELGKCVPDLNCPTDLDFDNTTGAADLLLLLSNFGQDCIAEPEWNCGDSLNFFGHDYTTVQIGEQCWFAENLRTDRYSNTDLIPGNLDGIPWNYTSHGAQTIYGLYGNVIVGNTNSSQNLEEYGRLYNYHATLDSRNICPNGWRVPTDNDWMLLELEIGLTYSEAVAFGNRGETSSVLKVNPNNQPDWNGEDSIGFSAVPGGARLTGYAWNLFVNFYHYMGEANFFWVPNGIYPMTRSLHTDEIGISRDLLGNTQMGYSVRCVKNQELSNLSD